MNKESAMRTPQNGPIRLEERQVFDIHNGAGLAVRCLSGAIWITQDGGGRMEGARAERRWDRRDTVSDPLALRAFP